MANILIVEDDIDLNQLIRTELEAEGHTIIQAFDGISAIQHAEEQLFDLIILDWMLPGIDGLTVCRRIRQNHLTPIIMLTAKNELVDRVLGLEVGADDYINKPFSMQELRARISAILRRVAFEQQTRLNTLSKGPSDTKDKNTHVLDNHTATPLPPIQSSPPLMRGPLCMHRDERIVTLDGKSIDLTRKEFDLLLLLASYPGRSFGREFLLEQVWGHNYEGLDRVVDTQITRLRKKLGSFGDKIVTVWGIGYRFIN